MPSPPNSRLPLTPFLLLSIVVIGLAKTSTSTDSGLKSSKYSCLGGYDPSSLPIKDTLGRFAQGPCAPVILIPGITGTRLVVNIDCETLLKTNKKLFNTCGWKSCGSKEFFKPEKQYKLWLPRLTSPLAFYDSQTYKKECWAGIMAVDYSATSTSLTIKSIPGVKVFSMGLSPSGRPSKVSQCGAKAIEYLVPDIPNPQGAQYFSSIISTLTHMGYVPGLTLHTAAYDFRLNS